MNDPPAQWAQSRTARTAIRFVAVGGGVVLSVTVLALPSRADETQLTQAPPGPTLTAPVGPGGIPTDSSAQGAPGLHGVVITGCYAGGCVMGGRTGNATIGGFGFGTPSLEIAPQWGTPPTQSSWGTTLSLDSLWGGRVKFNWDSVNGFTWQGSASKSNFGFNVGQTYDPNQGWLTNNPTPSTNYRIGLRDNLIFYGVSVPPPDPSKPYTYYLPDGTQVTSYPPGYVPPESKLNDWSTAFQNPPPPSSDGGGSGGQIPQGIRNEFGLGPDGQPLGGTPSGGWPAPPPAPDPGPAGSNAPGTVPPAPEPDQASPAPAQSGADTSGSAPPVPGPAGSAGSDSTPGSPASAPAAPEASPSAPAPAGSDVPAGPPASAPAVPDAVPPAPAVPDAAPPAPPVVPPAPAVPDAAPPALPVAPPAPAVPDMAPPAPPVAPPAPPVLDMAPPVPPVVDMAPPIPAPVPPIPVDPLAGVGSTTGLDSGLSSSLNSVAADMSAAAGLGSGLDSGGLSMDTGGLSGDTSSGSSD
jgi:hypothetical protein